MNELINKEQIKIEDMIYEIRCKQIMLDRESQGTNDTKYFL